MNERHNNEGCYLDALEDVRQWSAGMAVSEQVEWLADLRDRIAPLAELPHGPARTEALFAVLEHSHACVLVSRHGVEPSLRAVETRREVIAAKGAA